MNILWICNYPIPEIAKQENLSITYNESWLVNLSILLVKKFNIKLTYLFPQTKSQNTITGETSYLQYFGFNSKAQNINIVISELFDNIKPDVIHIMGTEFSHSLLIFDIIKSRGLENKTIISIQGLTSQIALHFFDGIPHRVVCRRTIKDIIRRTGLKEQQKRMHRRGEEERLLITKSIHVFGRTDWDFACVKYINPQINYHRGGEILREAFYSGKWDPRTIERHSVFIAQANYPIKGLHFAIEALAIVKEKYPDLKIYVGGLNIYGGRKIKKSSYELYVRDMISSFSLDNNIIFTDRLDALKMKERYLKCNVFLSPSSIENSPNSVAEAMILGVPIIASYVGGVSSMISNMKEGILYPANDIYYLANKIITVFENDTLAISLGENAKQRALKDHDKDDICDEIMNVYNILGVN